MPEALERALKRGARAKGLSGKRAGAYVYGTMRKAGWKPRREKVIRKMVARREKQLRP